MKQLRPYKLDGDKWWANLIAGLIGIADGLVILVTLGRYGTSWTLYWLVHRAQKQAEIYRKEHDPQEIR